MIRVLLICGFLQGVSCSSAFQGLSADTVTKG